MCGIAGSLASDPSGRADRESLARMGAAMVHRGPDGSGLYAKGPVGLVHRRLAIIDLSDAGRQPMTNEDGDLVLVANGEIYNHRELRAELTAKGHRFRSGSDNEVILHLYEELGEAVTTRLRGMFAFALWDGKRQQLLLARDRVGQKPLYYAQRPQGLVFASELGALLADPGLELTIDHAALDAYLALQYVPSPWTIFEDVFRLPAGHQMVLRCGGAAHPVPYWSLDFTPDVSLTADDAARRVRATVEEAVRLRLMSDVPLGAFLSGGVDSSIVVACMARASSAPVKTFSIGFDREADSEIPYARMIARRFQTDHHEQIVSPDMISVLPQLARHHGQPFADPSAVPTHYLSELTRKHVTVALSGDAGDESFGGYRRYVWAHVAHLLQRLPGPVLGVAARALRLTPTGPGRWARDFGQRLLEDEGRRYLSFIRHFSAEEKHELYAPELAERFADDATAERFSALLARGTATDALSALMELDVGTYLPDDILVKVDIASMAHSLEARSPLCDHHVLELAASIPSSLKIQGLTGKVVLKRAFADLIPWAILDRRKKGFSLPVKRWFRTTLRDHARDVLLSGAAAGRGLFRRDRVEALIARHQAGEDHGDRLWNLLALEVWFQEMIDGRQAFVRDVQDRASAHLQASA
ncbi:MAG TPA: asparagine synthase (glutamine-hydrolyzing) [Kofleriaceae bacterium]|nr:asparagine synthase (glutamine-hydrolyzing) [Kofleriaceae bacterium]